MGLLKKKSGEKEKTEKLVGHVSIPYALSTVSPYSRNNLVEGSKADDERYTATGIFWLGLLNSSLSCASCSP